MLIGRLITFEAFAVYLLDERRDELKSRTPSAIRTERRTFRLKLGQGLVGAAVADAAAAPRQRRRVRSALRRVRARHGVGDRRAAACTSRKPIGALNLLSRQRRISSAATTWRSCASSPRTSRSRIVNARLFEQSRLDAEALETLAEIGAKSRPSSISTSSSRASRS